MSENISPDVPQAKILEKGGNGPGRGLVERIRRALRELAEREARLMRPPIAG